MLTDVHSHDSEWSPVQKKVFSIPLHPGIGLDEVLNTLPEGLRISAGVHPWHAIEWADNDLKDLDVQFVHPRVQLIGEIGLDSKKSIAYEAQTRLLEHQLRIAEALMKPVIIHNVGHQAELIAYKRMFRRIPFWIIHGFRGKAKMAEHFVRHGFYLSFGPSFQQDALQYCPLDRLFLETDESLLSIGELCQKVSIVRNLTCPELEDAVERNWYTIGLK